MKKVPSIILSLLILSLFSQTYGQSLNILQRSNWDDVTQTYNDVWGYANSTGEYAILGSRSHTIFINVSQPNTPVEVARFAGGFTSSIWRDFKTYGNYAYGVADRSSATNRSGLQIFDLSGLPQTVTKVYDSYAFFDRAHNIFIDTVRGRMYVAGARDSTLSQAFPGYNGVMIFDLTQNPAQPTLLANVQLPGGYIHDLYVRNDTAYCAHVYAGVLGIYDLTVPTNPVTLASFTNYPGQGYTHSMWLRKQGDMLVFADETHGSPLKVLDVSDLQNLNLVSLFSSTLLAPAVTNSIAHNPIFRGDTVYISYYHDGVQAFDLSNPAAPVRVAYHDTYTNTNYNGYSGNWGIYPLLPSGIILGSDISTGLYVLEMLSPPLAIDGVNLEGTLNNGKVQLSVIRQQTELPASFILERKIQGGTWNQLSKLDVPTGSSELSYSDFRPPANVVYYRLLWEDVEGKTHVSNEVEIFNTSTQISVSVSPNPVQTGKSILLHTQSTASQIYIQLVDIQGKICFSGRFDTNSPITLPSQVKAGMYVLQCNIDGISQRLKLVVR